MDSEINIIIADDHPIVRGGLSKFIDAEPRFKVVAEASDGEEAVEKIQQLRPQIAILDIDMPKLDGFGVARELRKRKLDVEVIFLTIHSAEDLFNEAMDLGAKGYLLKESAITEIVSSIKAVSEGKHYLSPAISSYLIRRSTRAGDLAKQKPSLESLTQTERRILQLIAANKSSKEIAEELFINYRTVENHRNNICQKLDIHGHNALLKFALQNKSQLS
ncbi:MAG TPA: response regulator transcription factor [Blastocatellia bacterium]|nr:response regulator transcription factor [Blastocatellia bacterium]